jgi:hypothetical protein
LSPSVLRARLSGDGEFLVLYQSSGVTIRDRFAGTSATLPLAATSWQWPVVSSKGHYIAVTNSVGDVIVAANPLN